MEWTGARYCDGPTAEAQTHVDAPPDAVWPLVSDPLLMPELSDELQQIEWLDDASGAAVGATFRGHNRHPAMGEWTATSTVVECDAPRVFAWAVGNPAEPAATWRFTLEPDGDGTLLRQWVRLGPGRSGLSIAIDQLPEREQQIVFVRLRGFEEGMQANLASFKQRAEAANGTGA